MFVILPVGLEWDITLVYIYFILSHYLTFLKEFIQTNKRTILFPMILPFWKILMSETEYGAFVLKHCPLALLPSPQPFTHISFVAISGNLWWGAGGIPLGPNKDDLIIKYRERQVQDMKHGIGVLKKRDKRRFVIEAFVKRLDWTLWAFKYSYNYHKYQICIRFQRKQKTWENG